MGRKKKQFVTIVLLTVILVGLGTGYYFLSKSNREKEAAEAELNDKSIELYSVNKDEVAKIRYINETSEVSLVKKEDAWVREGMEDVPMNQDYIEGMLTGLETVTANNSLKPESEDLSAYGLDKPLLEVYVTMNDGTEHSIQMGVEVPSDSSHYSIVEGDRVTIYTLPVTLFNKFKYTETEMIRIEDSFEVNTSNITHFTLEREGKDTLEVRSMKEDANWEANYYEWSIIKPYPTEVMADTTNIKEFFDGFSNLSFDQCVEYHAKDLGKYGLDRPKAKMSVKYYDVVGSSDEETGDELEATSAPDDGNANAEEVREDKSYTLLIGEKDGEDSYYVKLEGKDGVYLLSATVVEPILELDIFHVSDQCVFLGKITDMSGYEFSVGGKTHTVVRKEEVKPKEEPEETGEVEDSDESSETEETQETVQTYYVNGHLVDSTEFVNIFSATYLLEVSGLADDSVKPEDDTPVLTLDYHMLTGEDVKLEFIPYDGSNFYRVNKNGVDYFLTDKRGVDDIVRRYTEFVDNLE